MTGLYNGIGVALLLSYITLIFNPLLTVLIIKEVGWFDHLGSIKKFIILGVIFLILATIVLFIIRNFLHKSLYWLVAYLIGIGLIYLFIQFKKTRNKSSI